MRETLRDRRTIMTLLLMPLLVYPLLSMALNRFLMSSAAGTETAYQVGVTSKRDAEQLDEWIHSPAAQPPDVLREASGGELAEFQIIVIEQGDPELALELNAVDVIARIEPARIEPDRGEPASSRLTLTTAAGNAAGEAARRILIERVQWFTMRGYRSRLEQLGSDDRPPVDVELRDHGELSAGSPLASMVPLVLVLMTITGAVYPAIDLTAGERERGTMEALMASPIPRGAVLLAKYVAVVGVALLTAIVNLVAMFTTLWAARLLPLLTGEDSGFPWIAVVQILCLLVLFSGFFAAILLSLTSFARSFKEAQAYLIPVMLLALAPAMLSLMPGIQMSGALSIAPLINIVLLARDVLASSVDPVPATAAVFSTIGYAGATLAVASRLFGGDAVQRSSGESFGSLFIRPKSVRPIPSVAAATAMTAILVPTYFLISNSLMRFLEHQGEAIAMNGRLVLNAVALAATFGLVPLVVAVLGRYRMQSTFRWHRPTIRSLVGAVLMGMGVWVFAHEAFVLADWLGIEGFDPAKMQQTRRILEAWKEVPPWLLLATLAATPALIEECCFRGFLFSSIRQTLSPTKTIVITAFLFGLFHVLTGNALLLERFVPSTLLGLILGWVAYRSGSVIPGILLHFVHNGLLELAGRYHEQIEFLGAAFDDQVHLPLTWLAGGATVAALGWLVVIWGTTPDKIHRQPETPDIRIPTPAK